MGDRLTQTVNENTTNYTLDLASGLTQVLYAGENFYTYGIGRISQLELYGNTPEYFITDALGSVRQLTHESSAVLMTQSYDPYGNVVSSAGSVDSIYGYTGEQTDVTGNVYLRARYYNPIDGRFLTKDTWGGQANQPATLNRWNYVEGNPINYTDPSGHYRVGMSGALLGLGQLQSQYFGIPNISNIFAHIINCPTLVTNNYQKKYQEIQYDLTGYLAIAMTEHGRDGRVKNIATAITIGEKLKSGVIILGAYVAFNELEGKKRIWDIKINIQRELGNNIVLCGTGINCHWFDYSTPGNIHFGYIAGLAKIDHYIAAIAGGWAEQTDLQDKAEESGILYDWKDCFKANFPVLDACDTPQDQAAVDFGFELAKKTKYRNGITDQQLRKELQANGMANFQQNPHAYDEYWYQVYPQ